MSEENRKVFKADIEGSEPGVNRNAWLVWVEDYQSVQNFTLTLGVSGPECQGIHTGDPFLIFSETNKVLFPIAFARVYLKRSTLTQTTFYFDGYIPITSSDKLNLKTFPSDEQAPIKRLEWSEFEREIMGIYGYDFSSFKTISGESPQEQSYIRTLLENAVKDDLLGPADGPDEEIVGMSVRDRYIIGRLAPKETHEEEFDDYGLAYSSVSSAGASGRTDDDESSGGRDVSTNQSLVPSSFGVTFCVNESVEKLLVDASWGRYIRVKSDKEDIKTGKQLRAWKRTPLGDKKILKLSQGKIQPFIIDKECPEVLFKVQYTHHLKTVIKWLLFS